MLPQKATRHPTCRQERWPPRAGVYAAKTPHGREKLAAAPRLQMMLVLYWPCCIIMDGFSSCTWLRGRVRRQEKFSTQSKGFRNELNLVPMGAGTAGVDGQPAPTAATTPGLGSVMSFRRPRSTSSRVLIIQVTLAGLQEMFHPTRPSEGWMGEHMGAP
jgi:hypothetical protein